MWLVQVRGGASQGAGRAGGCGQSRGGLMMPSVPAAPERWPCPDWFSSGFLNSK